MKLSEYLQKRSYQLHSSAGDFVQAQAILTSVDTPQEGKEIFDRMDVKGDVYGVWVKNSGNPAIQGQITILNKYGVAVQCPDGECGA